MGISFSNIGTVGREQLITSGSNGETKWSYIPSKGKSTKKVNNRTYQFEDEKMQVLCPQCVVGIDEIVAKINENNAPVEFLGDGVPVFTAYIEENCKVQYYFAPAHVNKQRSAAVAALGEEYYKAGKLESAEEHKPEYLRLSQAERERMEQHGNS